MLSLADKSGHTAVDNQIWYYKKQASVTDDKYIALNRTSASAAIRIAIPVVQLLIMSNVL